MSKPPGSNDPADSETMIGDAVAFAPPSPPIRGAQELPDALPQAGTRFGGDEGDRFELVEMLGRGAMGAVFLARDHVLERPVAIKFIIHSKWYVPREEMVSLFKQEARATARLNHESIMRVFDLGTFQGMPFLVMEYLEGQALSWLIDHERVDVLRATRLMADVARGLAHAHRMGIVHRDLKPSNIFVIKDGHAKVLDFGLATVLRTHDTTPGIEPKAYASAVAGTPRYMSPEQWRGEPQDGRTDLWALGTIFFELLTGRAPVESQDLAAIRSGMMSDAPLPTVRQLRPELPAEADAMIARALSKDLATRFSTADEFLDALVGLEVALSRSLRGSSHDHGAEAARVPVAQRQVSLASFALGNVATLSAELDLETVAELLANFFDTGRTVVRQLEGTLVTAAGGRMLACFGYPVAHEDDAQRAVRAALLIKDAVRGLAEQAKVELAFKAGVHTGPVLIGKTSADGTSPVLQGDAPDIAEWLERRAPPGHVAISTSTASLTNWLFELTSFGTHTPDGGTQALETFDVVGQKAAASRFEQSTRAGLTPLVGRDNEMIVLRRLWSDAQAGRGQFALISGEAGMGKSRLIEAVREQIVQDSGAKLTGQCWSYFQNAAFHPLLEIVQCAVGIASDDTAGTKLEKIAALLRRLQLDPVEHLPLIANFLSVSGSSVPALTLSPDVLRLRLIESLSTVFLALAAERPTLLLIEDGHWSDTSTQELLMTLMDRIIGARVLVLVTCRPQFAPSFPGRAHFHQLLLHRLPSKATVTMVVNASRGTTLPRDVIDALIARADGVPLFVEELTRMMVETSQAQADPAAPTTAPATASAMMRSIPATLNELLLTRLDRLAGAGKEVAQLGAVLGREFTYTLIDRCSHLDRDRLRGGLMQLVDAELIRHEDNPAGARYVFKHALVQEAAYGSLLKSHRRAHHQRVAETLERDFSELTEQQPELLAHHFVEAGAPLKAVPYLEKAGQRASQRSAHSDAVAHLSKAVALVAQQAESADRARKELALRLAMGAPLMALRGYAHAEVESNYARALDLSRGLGDDTQIFPATLGLWQFSMVGGRIPTSVELGKQLLAQAEASHDATSIMLAHRSLGTSLLLAGHPIAACEHTQAGLKLYDPAVHGKLGFRVGHDPGVAHGLYRGLTLWIMGHADEAVTAAEAALVLAQQLKHPLSIAFAFCYVSVIENLRGEHARARDHAAAAGDLCIEHNLALWAAMSNIVRGWAQAGLGQPDGIELLGEGIAAWMRTGARAGVTLFQAAQAWALLATGRHDEALAVVTTAQETETANGEHFFGAELARLRGESLIATSESHAGQSEQFFREALATAQQQEARAFALRSAISLARLLSRHGRAAEALQTLEPVYQLLKQGRGTVDLRNASALLDELRG